MPSRNQHRGHGFFGMCLTSWHVAVDTLDLPSLDVADVVSSVKTWGPYAPLLDLTINTSWFIATLLPKFIFRTGEPDIRVLTYPKAFKTSWETAEPVVPTLWKGNKADYGLNMEPDQPNTFNIDAMVLLGMDDDDDSRFSFEKKAYRGQFENRDFVNKAPSQADLTGNGTWALAPEVIETDLDVYGIYRQVKSEMKACPRYAVMDCS